MMSCGLWFPEISYLQKQSFIYFGITSYANKKMVKKIIVFSFLILLTLFAFGQKRLPIIKATNKKAIISEGEGSFERNGWFLDPMAKLDIFTTNKSKKAKWVTFKTDIDSIKIKLKAGQKFDFIVLLNGKDSCYTRLQSPALITKYAKQKKATHDTIPFELTAYSNLKIKAIVNSKDTLDLKFDSGAGGLLLTYETIEKKTHLLDNQDDKTKPDFDNLPSFNRLQLGNLIWDSLTVYPVALSGHGTDGRFGWDLFDGRIVEIDYDNNRFIIHSKLPKKPKGYSKLPIEYTHTLFCINATLKNKGIAYPNRFLFDNGYQRTIMLDSVLMAEQNFPKDLKVIKKVIMKNGRGQEIPVITVNNEQLIVGEYTLFDIPTQKLTGNNPARFKTHILGNEVLKRFNTILDFQNDCVYLKKNSLWNMEYKEKS